MHELRSAKVGGSMKKKTVTIEGVQERASKRIAECPGMTFGKLTVIRFLGYAASPSGRRLPRVECRCECGNIADVDLNALFCGNTKTCGNSHPRYEDRSLPAFNQLYEHAYKRSALRRGTSFELTRAEFRSIISRNCFYCGAPPVEFKRVSGVQMSICMANGVDRVDNALGYTLDNVVPCCFACNHAKHVLTQEDFLLLANKIAALHPVNFSNEDKVVRRDHFGGR